MSYAAVLAHLWRSRGFRLLTFVRILSQGGDGAFQVGIATAFFFDPQEAATPQAIALGFATLLAPFTLVGPFVGPLIDRWPRQRIVIIGNLVRLVLVGAICLAVVADAPVWSLYGLALGTLSVNRFLLAALTSGLPQVVAPEDLLAANAIMPTLGTVSAALGATIGAIVTFVVPEVSDGNLALLALITAGLAFGVSSWVASRLGKDALGPVEHKASLELWAQVRHLGYELREGFNHLRDRLTPLHALGVMAASRLLFGLMFVAAILISRHILGDPSDTESALSNFSTVLGFAAVGFGLAAVITPGLAPKVGRHKWIVWCLVAGAVGQAILASSSSRWALYAAAVIVSFAVQGGKIAVDTIIQRDTDDAYRGRAFTLYDMAYNTAFISAAAVGALVLPDSGYSHVVMASLGVAYLLVALVFSRAPRTARITPAPTADVQPS